MARGNLRFDVSSLLDIFLYSTLAQGPYVCWSAGGPPPILAVKGSAWYALIQRLEQCMPICPDVKSCEHAGIRLLQDMMAWLLNDVMLDPIRGP